MKYYRIENWEKIYMSFWENFNDYLKDIIIDSLDSFKYESDKMLEEVIEELLNAVKDDCKDISRKWIETYIKTYIKKYYPYN